MRKSRILSLRFLDFCRYKSMDNNCLLDNYQPKPMCFTFIGVWNQSLETLKWQKTKLWAWVRRREDGQLSLRSDAPSRSRKLWWLTSSSMPSLWLKDLIQLIFDFSSWSPSDSSMGTRKCLWFWVARYFYNEICAVGASARKQHFSIF